MGVLSKFRGFQKNSSFFEKVAAIDGFIPLDTCGLLY
jgi:hypothetical protein